MLVNEIRNEMVTALKNGDKERKQVYSGILDALTKEAKNLLVDNLTPEQEVQVTDGPEWGSCLPSPLCQQPRKSVTGLMTPVTTHGTRSPM